MSRCEPLILYLDRMQSVVLHTFLRNHLFRLQKTSETCSAELAGHVAAGMQLHDTSQQPVVLLPVQDAAKAGVDTANQVDCSAPLPPPQVILLLYG